MRVHVVPVQRVRDNWNPQKASLLPTATKTSRAPIALSKTAKTRVKSACVVGPVFYVPPAQHLDGEKKQHVMRKRIVEPQLAGALAALGRSEFRR